MKIISDCFAIQTTGFHSLCSIQFFFDVSIRLVLRVFSHFFCFCKFIISPVMGAFGLVTFILTSKSWIALFALLSKIQDRFMNFSPVLAPPLFSKFLVYFASPILKLYSALELHYSVAKNNTLMFVSAALTGESFRFGRALKAMHRILHQSENVTVGGHFRAKGSMGISNQQMS